MKLKTTLGQLLINDALPEDLQDYNRRLDKSSAKSLFKELAVKHPDKYKDVMAKLMDIGQDVSHNEGSSLSLKDLRTANIKKEMVGVLQNEIQRITSDPNLDIKDKNKLVIEASSKLLGKLDEAVYLEGRGRGNRLVNFADSGARGGKSNINQLTGAGLVVSDNMDRPVPVPILHNFSEGIDPAELWAGSYGVRSGYIALKSCLDKHTKVLMADGTFKEICKINVGDKVMGSDTEGNLSPTNVLEVFNNGTKDCYKYTFNVNRSRNRRIELIATEDHKVLAKFKAGRSGKNLNYSVYTPTPLPLRKAANCKDTTINPYVAEVPKGWNNLDGKVERDALLLGLFIGDGCLTQRMYTLSCADDTLIEDIKPNLAEAGIDLTRPKSSFSWVVKYAEYDVKNHATAGRNPFVKKCEAYDIGGKKAPYKELPADIWTWNNESICNLIAGLYAADGCVITNKFGNISIKISLTAKKVIDELIKLLDLRLGITVSSYNYKPKHTIPLGNHDQYEIIVSYRPAVTKFNELITMPGIKGRKLKQAVDAMPEGTHRNSECGFKSYSKEHIGDRYTYDLHVDNKDHLFVLANGLIVSNSTPKAGYLGKQLAQAAHKLTATDDTPLLGTGLPVEADDPDNEGAVLAANYGNYKQGTILTPKILKELRRKNKRILVHSPIASISTGRGIPRVAAGIREYGRLPNAGENVGISAAQSVSEPLSQSAISSKHTAGVSGASGGGSSAETQAGFDVINRMANIPKQYPDKAALTEVDGIVSNIEDAPQGGKYVYINNNKYHIEPEQEVFVKVGDKLEAGDVLSSGLPNPADIVKYKGVGEGRRYFMQSMYKTLKNSGVDVNRRNVELVTRSLINHIRVGNKGINGSLPGDLLEYDEFAARYSPRESSVAMNTSKALNKFLEQPTLHYSIGTRITPRVAKELQEFGVKDVMVSNEEPDFEPEMRRAVDTLASDDDWQVRLGGFNLERNLLDSVHRGATSTMHGDSYIPSLAQGVDFGTSDKTPY